MVTNDAINGKAHGDKFKDTIPVIVKIIKTLTLVVVK